jgi:hypothetical protein
MTGCLATGSGILCHALLYVGMTNQHNVVCWGKDIISVFGNAFWSKNVEPNMLKV